jgi:CubicO group peptidase (beta-lactamase class C family)
MRSLILMSVAMAMGAAAAQEETARKVDEIFQEFGKPGTPGASVAVIRDGRIVLAKGYGAATLEHHAPVTADTIFHVASVTKQFTAMALVLLERDGKLSLEDDVHKYLPELPDYGAPVTIRQLLQHTSGVRDQWQTLAVAGWRLDDVITQKQILGVMFRQKELNFPPGSRHLYSNGGYTLAAEIVARVSGKSFPDFCEQRIFQPLGMRLTHMHDDLRRIVPNRAYSYAKTKDGYEASPLNYANAGATSLFTTAPDLARWLDNFRDPKVGGRAAVDRLQERAIVGGKPIDYALGVAVGKHRGLAVISHSGGDAGFRSHVAWFPEHKLGVVVLSNLGSFDPGAATYKAAAVYLGDVMAPAAEAARPAERKFVTVDAASLDRYVGSYRMAQGPTIQVQKRDGKLYAAPPGQRMEELKPLAANRFFASGPSAEVEFTPSGSNGMSMTIRQGPGTMSGERIAASASAPADPSEYAGVYWSDEVEARYTLRVRDGKLVADHIRHGEIALTEVARDQFHAAQWFMQQVRFTRDGAGRVIAMTLGGGRLKGVRFARLSAPAGTRP